MESDPNNLFQITLQEEALHLTNREGILYIIPFNFLAKETNVGDQLASYQILRLRHTGLFTMDELYSIAATIEQQFPASLVNWKATFHIVCKENTTTLHKKLKDFQLI